MRQEDQTTQTFTNARVLNLLDAAGKKRLFNAAQKQVFPDGAIVVREGDPGDALYIITDGQAKVCVDDLGQSKIVAELDSGAIFGEMAVITSQSRSATVSAQGKLVVLRISKEQVLEILKDYPKVREEIARIGLVRTEYNLEKMLHDY